MLGQSCNGEFAIGEIESVVPVATDGVATFTARSYARILVGFGQAGYVQVGITTAVVAVDISTTAIANVEIRL